jgi:integrase
LERLQRQPPPQILHQQTRRSHLRDRAEGSSPPKNPGARITLAEILRASFLGAEHPQRAAVQAACKALIAEAGALPPQKLSAAHILEIDAQLRAKPYAPTTRWNYGKAIRQILRWLWENHGAPKLDAQVRKYQSPRPRNVTVRDDERRDLLAVAPPHLRLWILLCSDMAIRSGTAAVLGPAHYNQQRGTLSFTTKCDEHLTLPATAEIEALLRTCNLEDPESFVHQLWRRHRLTHRRDGPLESMSIGRLRSQFAQLRAKAGLTRRVTLHDHRRTTAVAMLRYTHDAREVQSLLGHKNLQSTFWYLDHDLRPIQRNTLEIIKRPIAAESEKQSA